MEHVSQMFQQVVALLNYYGQTLEVEHGEKLQALFDGFQAQDEKKEELKKRIKICEKKIDKQGDKIYYLSSIVNKK